MYSSPSTPFSRDFLLYLLYDMIIWRNESPQTKRKSSENYHYYDYDYNIILTTTILIMIFNKIGTMFIISMVINTSIKN